MTAQSNDPRKTWKLPSYLPPDPAKKKAVPSKRKAANGKRGEDQRRTLSSLLRF